MVKNYLMSAWVKNKMGWFLCTLSIAGFLIKLNCYSHTLKYASCETKKFGYIVWLKISESIKSCSSTCSTSCLHDNKKMISDIYCGIE